jgi:hypothetical protein
VPCTCTQTVCCGCLTEKSVCLVQACKFLGPTVRCTRAQVYLHDCVVDGARTSPFAGLCCLSRPMAGASSACSSGSPPPVGDGCVDFDVQLLGLALHEGFKLKDVSKEDWSSSGVCVCVCACVCGEICECLAQLLCNASMCFNALRDACDVGARMVATWSRTLRTHRIFRPRRTSL